MAKREPAVIGSVSNMRQRPSGDRVASVATWLWSRYTSVTTAGTSEEALYLDDLEANTLETNGDVLKLEYSGTFIGLARTKIIKLYFAGNMVYSSDDYGVLTTNVQSWTLRSTIVRESNTVIRVVTQVDCPQSQGLVGYTRLTGLSGLATNEYSVELRAETPDAAGDLTVTMCNALYIPVIT